jgi:hypothetical protein
VRPPARDLRGEINSLSNRNAAGVQPFTKRFAIGARDQVRDAVLRTDVKYGQDVWIEIDRWRASRSAASTGALRVSAARILTAYRLEQRVAGAITTHAAEHRVCDVPYRPFSAGKDPCQDAIITSKTTLNQ